MFMFSQSTKKIIRNTNIKNLIVLICENIDVKVFLHEKIVRGYDLKDRVQYVFCKQVLLFFNYNNWVFSLTYIINQICLVKSHLLRMRC